MSFSIRVLLTVFAEGAVVNVPICIDLIEIQ